MISDFVLTGPDNAAPLVFLNGAGCDMRVWNGLIDRIPDHYRILRFDLDPTCKSMGALVRDTETLLDQLDLKGSVLIGHSLGGMIAQGLAVKRFDLVRAMILTGTAAKIDTPAIWNRRQDAIARTGLEAQSEQIVNRWLSRRDQSRRGCLQDMLLANGDRYDAAITAISGTDFFTPTSGLGLSTLGIAGIDDQTTPPDLQRETIDLIHGSQFELIRRAGHFAWLDQPEAFFAHLSRFLDGIGHAMPNLT